MPDISALGPLPEVNPRDAVVRHAESELHGFLVEIGRNLTEAELILVMANAQRFIAQSLVAGERSGSRKDA